MSRGAAIAAHGIAKRFGHVEALVDATIEVAPGEVVALFGDNGAGKTTLLNCLLGNLNPDAGQITAPPDLSCVYQELALAPDLSVADSLFLGRERLRPGLLGRVGVLDRGAMARSAEAALDELGIALPPVTAPVKDLSGGQRQAVAVARAVMWASDVVLMDEPTAALGTVQSDRVCSLIRGVADRGLGVLVVSHDLPRFLEVADRAVALWRGRSVLEAPTAELTVPDVVATMVGYRKR